MFINLYVAAQLSHLIGVDTSYANIHRQSSKIMHDQEIEGIVIPNDSERKRKPVGVVLLPFELRLLSVYKHQGIDNDTPNRCVKVLG